jgi:nucleoside-diphosphate-sugar epimerase
MTSFMGQKPKIVLTGANSLVARYLVPELLENSSPLILLGRHCRHPKQSTPVFLRLDLEQPAERVMAAKKLVREDQPITFIHLAPVWLLPDFLQELLSAGVFLSRLIAFSSTSLLVKQYSQDSAERKLAACLSTGEEKVKALCGDRIPWTIFRPTLTYDGRHDKNVAFIRSFICRFGFFPVAGSAAGLRQPVHAADLAAAVMAVLDNQRTHNRTYNLGGGETLTYRQMVARIFQGLEKREKIISLPPGLFILLIKLLSFCRPHFGVSPAMVRRMNEDLSFDFKAAARDFFYQPGKFRC